MFVFDNVITAGTVLVRQQIESQNWESSGHTQGWVIGADGNATFNNVILQGDLQSSNYVPGVSGYKLDWSAGSAEFSDTTIRGVFATGFAPDTRIEITNQDQMLLWAGYTGVETGPARFFAYPAFDGHSTLLLESNEDNSMGTVYFQLVAPQTDSEPGGWRFNAVNALTIAPSIFETDDYVVVRLHRASAVSVTSTDHAFQIGEDSSPNLAFDTNEIMARDNGAAASLVLNDLGGFTSTNMRGGRSNDAGPRTTTSVTYATAASTASLTIPTPPSKSFSVSISADCDNSSATGLTWIGWEVRENNAAGAILTSGNDGLAGMNEGTSRTITGRTVFHGVVTSAANLFIRPMFKVSAGTGTYNDISISVIPSP